jgi:ATP sulfurylase
MSLADLEMLAVGAMSPLSGFMNRADYERVVSEIRLADGTVWSIPVTLPVAPEVASGIREGQEVALVEGDGNLLAVMTVQDKFTYDKHREAREVYRTEEDKHPGVARLYRQAEILLGGPISLIDFPAYREFLEFRHTPVETRRMFARRGWKTIVAFQTCRRAHGFVSGDSPRLLPARSGAPRRVSCGHALRRPARGDLSRAVPQELWLHALYRRP